MNGDLKRLGRALLVLGRVSNLPTVWSNCLAGWWLGGGGEWSRFWVLCIGASLLYVGGMYLNDAFDAEFDRQWRRERPIPSGAVSERWVWGLGGAWLVMGWVLLATLGWSVGGLAAVLVGVILIYDASHKAIAFSPVIMSGCRFFLILVAAAVGRNGVTGLAVWTAVALAGWVIGLSYVAKREALSHTPLQWWPLAVMALPLALAGLVNNGEFRVRGILWMAVVGIWAWMCLRHSLGGKRSFGRTVSGLLAGICLVDLLAVNPGSGLLFAFLGCFVLALVAQRFIPAT